MDLPQGRADARSSARRDRGGVWRPPRSSAIGDVDQTFHEFASRWWAARRPELRPTTQSDYEWRLRKHLLPFFADFRVSDITVAFVDEYRNEKMVERERIRALAEAGMPLRDKRGQRRVALSNESINKTLVLLANILDAAVEYELLPATRRAAGGGGPKPRGRCHGCLRPMNSARSSPRLRSWIVRRAVIAGSGAAR